MNNCPDCQTPVGCRATSVCSLQLKQNVEKAFDVKAASEASLPEVQGNKLGESQRPTPEILVEGSALGATAAEAFIAAGRLCIKCSHSERPGMLQQRDRICKHPELPMNLVDGSNKFPCIIARGYNQLCGPLGLRWRYNGK